MTQPDFDLHNLNAYLEKTVAGFHHLQVVEAINGGNSNPTYRLKAASGDYVLRRKPPGTLLKSAHAVDREYRVIKALATTDIPVPQALHLCEDEEVIGSMFYVMAYLPGRVFWSPQLPELSAEDRRAIYWEMNGLLIKLHNLDIESIGLADYGKSANYFDRQINRWTKQYRASETRPIPAVEKLIDWLSHNRPEEQYKIGLVHGDFRLDNIIFSPSGTTPLGILDWELSTLGHPYADLAYQCMQWRLPVEREELRGLGGVDRRALGIPDEQEYVERYCRGIGVDNLPNWNFYLAVNFFRLVAICQGIYKRGLEGNATSNRTERFGTAVDYIATTALTALE